eukprot:TRINITY_DN27232_c0_g1_i2.p1 TRINITY_DN27232_c0_g1~~TRINITY_DN27232_c0_g1_i2.p1  ORF type:complete len:560 (+),score=97.71 TRINITY_DN27232_c0_g1_i2:83-1762(+)
MTRGYRQAVVQRQHDGDGCGCFGAFRALCRRVSFSKSKRGPTTPTGQRLQGGTQAPGRQVRREGSAGSGSISSAPTNSSCSMEPVGLWAVANKEHTARASVLHAQAAALQDEVARQVAQAGVRRAVVLTAQESATAQEDTNMSAIAVAQEATSSLRCELAELRQRCTASEARVAELERVAAQLRAVAKGASSSLAAAAPAPQPAAAPCGSPHKTNALTAAEEDSPPEPTGPPPAAVKAVEPVQPARLQRDSSGRIGVAGGSLGGSVIVATNKLAAGGFSSIMSGGMRTAAGGVEAAVIKITPCTEQAARAIVAKANLAIRWSAGECTFIVRTFLATVAKEQDWFAVTAMEKGEVLRGLVAQGLLSGEEAAVYGLHVARGIEFMHRQGWVHTDIKSSNVIVTGRGSTGDGGRAKLIDMDTMTAAGDDCPTGTCAFLPPEAFQSRRAKPTWDVWAAGVLVHEAASGKVPLGVRMQLADLPAEVVDRLRKARPDANAELLWCASYAQSWRTPHTAGLVGPRADTELPDWAAPIVEATWKRDPAERATAAHLVEMLGRVGAAL